MIGVKQKTEEEIEAIRAENVDTEELMDKVVLKVSGTDDTTMEKIIELGWQKVPDRGLSENNAYLFYGPNNWVLRYWTVAPRLELRFKNSVAWDSAMENYSEFGPGKPLEIGRLKEKMIAHGIV